MASREPCQDLSVAGKRAGLRGERSSLFYEYVRIAKTLRPRFLLLENVPGLLSSCEGQDVQRVLDSLASIGYIVDVDEVDSQHHGVPQRRRRLFFIGIDAANGLTGKTHFSETTRLNCLVQSLLDALELLAAPSITGSIGLASSPSASARGLMRKMLSCGNSPGMSPWLNLPAALDATLLACANTPRGSVFQPDELGQPAVDTESEQKVADEDGNISKLWRRLWADLSEGPSSSTISTWSRRTTAEKTLLCSEILLNTCEHIAALRPSCPFCLSVVSSCLTALDAATESLARMADDLFAEETGRNRARVLLRQTDDTIRDLEFRATEASVRAVLFEPESGEGHPAASREAGADVAGTLAAGAHPSGFNGQDAERGMLVMRATGRGYWNDDGLAGTPGAKNLIAGTLKLRMRGATDEVMDNLITHTLTGHGASGPSGAEHHNLVTATLNSGGNDGGLAETPGAENLVFDPRQITSPQNRSTPRPGAPCHTLPATGSFAEAPMIMSSSICRRLTPMESERLQGFPDGWSCLCQPLTAYAADPDAAALACRCPDSPRYRALGNAVTVPVVEWLGRRLRGVQR